MATQNFLLAHISAELGDIPPFIVFLFVIYEAALTIPGRFDVTVGLKVKFRFVSFLAGAQLRSLQQCRSQ